jgi:hypothetical protein
MPPNSNEGDILSWGAYGMNRTFKATAAALIFAAGFAGSVAAGPFEDAVLPTLRATTQQGRMYYRGDGVRKTTRLR